MTAPCLILAVGNESRGDDALGPLLLRRLGAWIDAEALTPQIDLLEEFQLQIEHTLDLAGRQRVLFIDAGDGTAEPFRFYRATPQALQGHTSHALAPEALLGVYAKVHGQAPPPAFVLCIAGKTFELGAAPTARAMQNMQQAFELACKLLRQTDLAAWQAMTDTP